MYINKITMASSDLHELSTDLRHLLHVCGEFVKLKFK